MVFPGNNRPRPSTMARFPRSMRLLGAAALATAALADPVLGQGFDIRSLFNAPGDHRHGPAGGGARRPGLAGSPGMERRIRLLRSPPDDGRGHSLGGGQFPQLPRRALAAGRAARRHARGLRREYGGSHAGPADHGFDGLPARVHQIVLGLSRYPGQRRADREWPRDPRAASHDLRRGREGLWRRPPFHRRHLGRRIQLQHPDRRPLGDPFDGDARLRRSPPGLFPRGVSLGAGDPGARRCAAGPSQGLVGGRLRPDPVHADLVQALRRRFRRRRPPRRRRTRCPISSPRPRTI